MSAHVVDTDVKEIDITMFSAMTIAEGPNETVLISVRIQKKTSVSQFADFFAQCMSQPLCVKCYYDTGTGDKDSIGTVLLLIIEVMTRSLDVAEDFAKRTVLGAINAAGIKLDETLCVIGQQ